MKLFIGKNWFSLKKTQFYDMHIAKKGKMGNFEGYEMPIQFPGGMIKEHLHCRQQAIILEVSHMGQLYITGQDRVKLLERITVGNSKRRAINGATQSYLTMLLTESAGILDDCIAVNMEDQEVVRIVLNAINKYIDMEHINKIISKENLNVKAHLDQTRAQIALQGPYAQTALQNMTLTDLSKIPFMSTFMAKINQKWQTVSRTGFTGEDGFEISGTTSDIIEITQALLKDEKVQLAGLGGLNSLRTQAGLCLYGYQISTKLSPFEAGLMWAVYKRKQNDERVKFIGEDILRKIVNENKTGIRKDRQRVGFILDTEGFIGENCRIFNQADEEVGRTSSGVLSPVLRKCIGMAFVDASYMEEGTKLKVEKEGIKYPITIAKMPFVPTRYYKRWKDFVC